MEYKKITIIILLHFSILFGQNAFSDSYEYKVKAVFLERFTRFIEWPADTPMSDTTQPFVIGILGDNPFGTILSEMYKGKKIKDKEISILYLSDINEIAGCDMLFISKSKKDEISKIISFVRNKPILTVSEVKGFAEMGIIINFYFKDSKLHFEINNKSARVSGLKISYLLLQTARVID